MKKILFLSFLCISAMFVGCTSVEDEPQLDPTTAPVEQGEEQPAKQDPAEDPADKPVIVDNGVIDMNVLNAYRTGTAVASFNLVEYHIWDAPENTDNWVESFIAPHGSLHPEMAIQEGKIWRRFQYSHHPMWDPLSELALAWTIYKQQTKSKEKVWYSAPFASDKEANEVKLDGYTFEIIGMDANSFKLGFSCKINKQKKGWFDSFELYSYAKAEPIDFTDGKNTATNSEKEACYYILEKIKGRFGRYMDRNKYLDGAILDDSVLDLDKVKRDIDNYFRNK